LTKNAVQEFHLWTFLLAAALLCSGIGPMTNNSNQAALLGLGSFNPAYSTLPPPQLPRAFPGGAAPQLGAPTMFPLPPANNPFLEMSTVAAQQQQAPRQIGSLPQNVFQVQYIRHYVTVFRFQILSIYQGIKVISGKNSVFYNI
jgi:hypothetical protein